MKILVAFLMVCLFPSIGNSAHILGSEVSYRFLGGTSYEITFKILRDANSGGADFDSPLHYTVRKVSGNAIVGNFNVVLKSRTDVPPTINDPCVKAPPGYKIESGLYIDTIQLNLEPMGYYVTYQRCCWANDIININNPDGVGLTVTTTIPGTNLVTIENNSPYFKNVPPVIICNDNPFVFDYSAIDIDGDSLVYSLCDPLGFVPVGNNNNPNPDLQRPYSPVSWAASYNSTIPFGAQSPVTLDPETGLFTFTPSIVGRHLTSVCIEEYRNGILINEKSSIVNFEVQSCQQTFPFEISIINEGVQVGGEGGGIDPTFPKFLSEDCGSHSITINRDVDTTEILLEILLSGSATSGVDFPNYPDTLIIPKGVSDTSINIFALFDGVNEPTENIIFNLRYFDPCASEYDSIVMEIIILDYRNLLANVAIDSINFCPDLGEQITLEGIVTQGIPPYSYKWSSPATEQLPNSPFISLGEGILTDQKTPFHFVVTDQCGKTKVSPVIDVYDQCPIIVPNVITLNGDYINDVFVIRNLENFDAVELKIFNRWGELLYENDHYQNNWTVDHKDGTPLGAGVYFYFANVVNSEKYQYDDNKKTIYQAQGFFHVLVLE